MWTVSRGEEAAAPFVPFWPFTVLPAVNVSARLLLVAVALLRCGRPALLGPHPTDTGTLDWAPREVAVKPPARWFHAMAYDAHRQRTVLFGGGMGLTVFGDTWEWDGERWELRAPRTSPKARTGHAMTYDPIRQRVVLFGGADDGTWEWNGDDWETTSSIVSPPSSGFPAMAFDAERSRVILFTRTADKSRDDVGETWHWDGKAWERLAVDGPTGFYRPVLVFDPLRAVVVAYDSTLRDDQTWELDRRGRWLRTRSSTSSTDRRAYSAGVFDERRGRVSVFGGSFKLDDLVEWNGATWTARMTATRPPGRQSHAIVYDSARRRMVLFGGLQHPPKDDSDGMLDDTWEL